MGAVVSVASVVVTSLTWCFCQALTSLFCACCGNDKPSTVPPSATSGRKRSVLVLLLAIGAALGFQYGVAPYLVDTSIDNFLKDGWLDGCEDEETDGLTKSCAGNNGNYRAMAATVLFYILAAIGAALKPTANREAWPAKYVLYLFMVGITIFIPSDPLFSDVFLNIARIGGFIFVIVQQFIIVDMAFNWNDSWVNKSNQADADEIGSGKKWLIAILVSCAVLYLVSLAALIAMFIKFTGCPSNNAFISLTLILVIAIHVAQLTGDEGSLLSSAVVAAWSVFLCYTAVSKNPDEDCNPYAGDTDPLSIAFGLIVTILSLGWTGFSYTAEDRLMVTSADDHADEEQAAATASGSNDEKDTKADEKRKVTGVVTGGADYGTTSRGEGGGDTGAAAAAADDDDDEDMPGGNDPRKLSNSWRLNIVLAAVTCWTSMVLTHWGEIIDNGEIANSDVGRASMWILISSQWIALSLYLWTLSAPRLFPGRDFS